VLSRAWELVVGLMVAWFLKSIVEATVQERLAFLDERRLEKMLESEHEASADQRGTSPEIELSEEDDKM
jgi:hypothetical protein